MTEHTPGIPLGSWLADLPDERLIRLLELRPDLAQPPPGSIAALAARAQARQSVKAATELLSEGSLRFVIREGFDIKTVTKLTRDVAACIEAALRVRDRTCARPGCAKRLGLEIDHRDVDFGDDGPTELDNLVRLCPECHHLKTHGGWRLEGRPGAWEWIAPDHPKSASYIARARKLAAAKGRARAARAKANDATQAKDGAQGNGNANPNDTVRRNRGSP